MNSRKGVDEIRNYPEQKYEKRGISDSCENNKQDSQNNEETSCHRIHSVIFTYNIIRYKNIENLIK